MVKNLFGRREDEIKKENEGRLPPGQSLTQKFPVLHYGPVPNFNQATWKFKVWGEVENETGWDWNEFQKLPTTEVNMDIHCVTQWSKFDTSWSGVSIATLIDEGLIKLKKTANYLLQHAEYGYTVNIPIQTALSENFLLATHFNGKPITPDHGYPLRGVVGAIPGRDDLHSPYLWKGAKWLRGIEFKEHDQFGFWEQAGYHNDADVWKEERFSR